MERCLTCWWLRALGRRAATSALVALMGLTLAGTAASAPIRSTASGRGASRERSLLDPAARRTRRVPSRGCAIPGTLWCGNFSTGDASQWTQVLGLGGEFAFPRTPALASTHSLAVTLRPGELWTDGTNRAQLREADDACGGEGCWTEGADVYYHVDLYIGRSTIVGARFANPWRALFSWPTSEAGECSNGGFQLATIDSTGAVVPGGTPALEMTGHNCDASGSENNYWWLLHPVKGAWYQFIVHRHYSSSPTVGFEEIWLKSPGRLTYTAEVLNGPAGGGRRRAHFATLGCHGCRANLRLGIYRNQRFTTTDVIYYDDVRAADSYAAAR